MPRYSLIILVLDIPSMYIPVVPVDTICDRSEEHGDPDSVGPTNEGSGPVANQANVVMHTVPSERMVGARRMVGSSFGRSRYSNPERPGIHKIDSEAGSRLY